MPAVTPSARATSKLHHRGKAAKQAGQGDKSMISNGKLIDLPKAGKKLYRSSSRHCYEKDEAPGATRKGRKTKRE